MIEYLKGEITELDPTMAVVECHGVGYACAISVYTYDHLKKGQVQKIYVSESIREDAHLLYGFSSKQERELYELLITVSGVGPNTARCILSSLSPDELVAVVSHYSHIIGIAAILIVAAFLAYIIYKGLKK